MKNLIFVPLISLLFVSTHSHAILSEGVYCKIPNKGLVSLSASNKDSCKNITSKTQSFCYVGDILRAKSSLETVSRTFGLGRLEITTGSEYKDSGHSFIEFQITEKQEGTIYQCHPCENIPG